MKTIKSLLVTLLFLIGNHLFAQTNYALAKNYKVTINGGSNLHDWEETAEKVVGSGLVTWNSNGTFDLNSLKIVAAVNSIKSSEGATMNGKTYKALKSESHPAITFTLTSPLRSVQNGNTVSAAGDLNIAGKSNPVTLRVKVAASPNGNITVEGAEPLKMTDFGIDPPTALFGALKVSNDVTIHFQSTFIKQ